MKIWPVWVKWKKAGGGLGEKLFVIPAGTFKAAALEALERIREGGYLYPMDELVGVSNSYLEA
jgi:hypothetical protein